MLDDGAARFSISDAPQFSVEILLSVRAVIDAILASLPSESAMENNGYAQTHRKSQTTRPRPVRTGAAAREVASGPKAATGSSGGSPSMTPSTLRTASSRENLSAARMKP